MKSLRLQSAILVLVCALGVAGCTHKKPVPVAPQPPQTATPQPTPTPEPATQPAEQPQEAQPAPTPAEQTPTATTGKHKTKSGQRSAVKKPAPATSAAGDKSPGEVAHNTSPKIVVQPPKPQPPVEGGPIAPGPTPTNATNDQASTDQLLQNAESNLSGIKRQLTPDEEAMRVQIREFITQSHKAITENDPQRAHILAVKARLLSEELVKQK